MIKVTGVRFKNVGKVYYFSPNGLELKPKDKVIVETARGLECGEVTFSDRGVADDEISGELKPVIRSATEKDLRTVEENKEKEKAAFDICLKKIEAHNLKMKLVDVEYTLDRNKILFYFTADGRVDFRELVKDLASVFRTRIELRQIGVRDESKMVGGLGICGRPFCCNTFLGDFQPVSVKMAKEQSLSLSPVKISGTCGRLMCCLKYENDIYMELRRGMPEPGEKIKTPDGLAKVVDTNILENKIRVRLFMEDTQPAKGKKDKAEGGNTEEQAEKLTPDIYTYKKEEIKRIEKRRDSSKNIFEGMDADTMKEIEELIKD